MGRLAVLIAAIGRIGCQHDAQQGPLDRPAQGGQSYFACTSCLADDAKRCATFTPSCGDSREQLPSETGAKDALCDGLGEPELAKRPTPTGFKPSPWAKNACYAWPADAFKTSCTTVAKACDSVPIH